MKRLRTDDQLRSDLRQCCRRAAVICRRQLESMVADGATPRMVVSSLIALNPLPGQPDYDRVCEMANAGEFDEFFSELLSVSQN